MILLVGREVTLIALYELSLNEGEFKLSTKLSLSEEYKSLGAEEQIALNIGLVDSLNSLEFSNAQDLELGIEQSKTFSFDVLKNFPLTTKFSFIQDQDTGVIHIDSEQSEKMDLLTPPQELAIIGSVIDILNSNTKTLFADLKG